MAALKFGPKKIIKLQMLLKFAFLFNLGYFQVVAGKTKTNAIPGNQGSPNWTFTGHLSGKRKKITGCNGSDFGLKCTP